MAKKTKNLEKLKKFLYSSFLTNDFFSTILIRLKKLFRLSVKFFNTKVSRTKTFWWANNSVQ